jgi:ribosome-associated heat shock protein Hsp15
MEPLRVDKWLWAARFYKTRGLAIEAVKGGRVEVNDQRAKPSKDVAPGDRITVSYGQGRRIEVVVRGTAPRRGPAKEAALLYEETAESAEARQAWAAERRAAGPPPGAGSGGRPTKRDRRRLEAMRAAQRRGG